MAWYSHWYQASRNTPTRRAEKHQASRKDFPWPDASDQGWPDAPSVHCSPFSLRSAMSPRPDASPTCPLHHNLNARSKAEGTPFSARHWPDTGQSSVTAQGKVRSLCNSSFSSLTSPPLLKCVNYQVNHMCTCVSNFSQAFSRVLALTRI
jgi:hypothetical protein